MQDRWSRFHKQCVNCSSTRRRHAKRGHCTVCARAAERIWAAELWDLNDQKSLSTMPEIQFTYEAHKAEISIKGMNDSQFLRFRCEAIRQYGQALASIKALEERRAEQATGWDIEARLVYVARNLRPPSKGDQFFSEARFIQDAFSDEQRRIIYGWLVDMTDHFPLPKLDYEELWRRVLAD